MIIANRNEVKIINNFFKTSVKSEVDKINAELLLTETQFQIYHRKYILKQDIALIADDLGYSRAKIDAELLIIRKMLIKLI